MTSDQSPSTVLRLDHRVIIDMVRAGSRVLDLGCGDGELLSLLIKHKSCRGTGIEIDEQAIYTCIAKGLTVSQGDINSGLRDYSDKRFDYVILNESLQEVLNLKGVILEALRVGGKVIVGIPNFCHIIGRFQIFFRGRVPMTKELPYAWYNTPNVRFFSLRDFSEFCRDSGIRVEAMRAIGPTQEVRAFPNLFAHIGIFQLSKNDKEGADHALYQSQAGRDPDQTAKG